MLSVAMLSTGFARAAAVMSPERNPCRVRDLASNIYRYDPYASKVMPSPMKTQLISPVKCPATPVNQMQPAHHQQHQHAGMMSMGQQEAAPQLHRNSLFAAPTPAPVMPVAPVMQEVMPMPQQQDQYQQQQPRMVEQEQQPQKQQMVGPAPIQIFGDAKPATSESAKTHYAIIYFKHDSATFIAPFRIAPGDHVIVEGDRGLDLGRVGEITTVTPTYRVPNKIVRRATKKDMEAFQQKQLKEKQTAQQIQVLSDEMDLGVAIVDTEFQFDNNKLTVFFSGLHQIDFRKLQRTLFREHRCRIWLSNMGEVEFKEKVQQTRRTR